MNNYYSAKNNGFYPLALKPAYEASGDGWPDDAVEVLQQDYDALFAGQTAGKEITADSEGHPVLTEPSPPTKEQSMTEAAATRDALMAAAEATIAPLKRAVKYGIATDAEKQLLEEWELYTVTLSRLDLTTAPDIDWPVPPKV